MSVAKLSDHSRAQGTNRALRLLRRPLMGMLMVSGLVACDRQTPKPVEPAAPQVTPTTVAPRSSSLPKPDAASVARFAGKYQANLPCADCKTIETQVTLHQDGTALWEQRYINRNPQRLQTTQEHVSWTGRHDAEQVWLKVGSINYYFDQPTWGELRMLDLQALPITGKTAAQYHFTEQPLRPLPKAQPLPPLQATYEIIKSTT